MRPASLILSAKTTPATRFIVLAAPGLAALIAVTVWALRSTMVPPDGSQGFVVHPAVWVSQGVGLCAYVTAIWIWALKPRDPAAALFALSGLMTLLFTFAAAGLLIADIEPSWLRGALGPVNIIGASGFGIVMICLFLIYPSRLPFWRWGAVAACLGFGLWTLAYGLGPFRRPNAIQPITLVEMLLIIAIIAWQIRAARHDPRQSAIAVWLGTCVLLGAGAFIVMVSAPLTFGMRPLILPHYAFASFLVIYAGVAIGLIRYKLFELGAWAFQMVFHAAVAIAIMATDALLIAVASLAPGMALGFSLLIAAFVYLPIRSIVWRRVTRGRLADETELFRAVIEAALKPSGPQRVQSWQRLLQDWYRPLELVAEPTLLAMPRIEAEGLALRLPATAGSGALVLRYPHAGRALFRPSDLTVAQQIIALMRHAEDSRHAYDQGVSSERTRIARDIHDNIGAQLLRALHSGGAERKDALIRDTLADLRDVINNAQSLDMPLDIILADLRAETADRLSPHDVTLDWQVEGTCNLPLPPAHLYAVRALVREATSNFIKHANARVLQVAIRLEDTGMALLIEDDGRGIEAGLITLGHGLDNMKARVESLGGTFGLDCVQADPRTGTRLTALIPFSLKESL